MITNTRELREQMIKKFKEDDCIYLPPKDNDLEKKDNYEEKILYHRVSICLKDFDRMFTVTVKDKNENKNENENENENEKDLDLLTEVENEKDLDLLTEVENEKNLDLQIEVIGKNGNKKILTMPDVQKFRTAICKGKKIKFGTKHHKLTYENTREIEQYELFKKIMLKALVSKDLELELGDKQTEIFISNMNQSNLTGFFSWPATAFIFGKVGKLPIIGGSLPKFTIRQKEDNTLEISAEFYFIGYNADNETEEAEEKRKEINEKASSFLDKCERLENAAFATAKSTLSLNKAATGVKFTYSIESRDPNLRVEPLTIIGGNNEGLTDDKQEGLTDNKQEGLTDNKQEGLIYYIEEGLTYYIDEEITDDKQKGPIDGKQKGLFSMLSAGIYNAFATVAQKVPKVEVPKVKVPKVKMPTAKGALNTFNSATSSVTSATSSVTSAVTSLWKSKKSNESKKKNESGSAVNNDGNTDLKSAVEKAGIDPKSLDKLTQDELTAFEASYKLFLEQQNQKAKNGDNKNNNDDSKPRND